MLAMEALVAADILVAVTLLGYVVAIAAIWWHAKTYGTDGPEE